LRGKNRAKKTGGHTSKRLNESLLQTNLAREANNFIADGDDTKK
jgi:hypothetical protein